MRKSFFVFFILELAVFIPLSSAQAAKSPHVEARLVTDQMNSMDTTFRVGVFFQIEPDWHIYWRNSGDSGIPTQINLTFPKPCSEGEWKWPVPKQFDEVSLTTYGYENSVLIFKTVTCDVLHGEIKARVEWLSCKDICVPGRADLVASFPSGDRALFDESQKAVPVLSPWPVILQEKQGILSLNFSVPNGFKTPDSVEFFPYENDWMDHHAKQSWKTQPGSLLLELKRSNLKKGPVKVSGALVAIPDWGESAHQIAMEIHAE